MSMSEHVRILSQRALVIAALAVVGATIGFVAAISQPAQFASTSLIALGPKSVPGGSLATSSQALYDRSVPSTLAQVAMSGSVVGYASEATGVDPASFETRAAVANDANAVEVTVTGGDPQDTQRLASAITSQSIMRFSQLYPLFRPLTIAAAGPGEDIGTSPAIAAAAGALTGLLLGSLIAMGLGRRHQPLAVVPASSARAVG